MTEESQLIERFFRGLGARRSDVTLGIGDDAAVVAVPPGHELVLTTDSLVAGTHFLANSNPRSLGHRALAVNLSDCAAMGAQPAWALLSLTLPGIDADWLGPFAAGFGALASTHGVALIGGNLARGPLHIAVQLTGILPHGSALTRAAGTAGDLLCVTGSLGDAAGGRELLQQSTSGRGTRADHAWLIQRFEYPSARVTFGTALRGLASACIDISDGALRDLTRLAQASGCGLRIDVERLPLSEPLLRTTDQAWQLALQGGEDYELGIAVPPARWPALQACAAAQGLCCTAIGQLHARPDVELRRHGVLLPIEPRGFDHFAT